MELDTVRVELGERSYDILIGRGALSVLGERIRRVSGASRVMVVSNPTVFGLYGARVLENLEGSGFSVSCHCIPDGEEYKSLATASGAYETMVSAGLDRESLVVSLGGGVVGDLAGFVAATYMRGIPFVQVPTTLLSQVDASVGGKVGVNLPSGKNLVGAFHQPLLVISDTEVLGTLERRDLVAGFAEVIKHAVLSDRDFFGYIEENRSKILALDEESLSRVVGRCCGIKAGVVAQDERERGVRALLNYGHTVGHAVESLAGYGEYRHGEAVAIGMVCAARIARRLGRCGGEDTLRQLRLIEASGLPSTAPGLSADAIIGMLARDKKVSHGKVRFVLAGRIGEAFITTDVPEAVLREVLEEMARE